MSDEMHRVMWEGDWSTLADEVCAGDGQLEIWDQPSAVRCADRTWNLPMTDEQVAGGEFRSPRGRQLDPPVPRWAQPHSVYVRLFDRRHPTPMIEEP